MTFASLEFAVLLATTLFSYYFLPQRARQWLLLVTSYVFYCYWQPFYAVLIFLSSLLDFAAGRVIADTRRESMRKLAVWASVAGNLGMLGYFKYTDFALDSLRSLLGPLGGSVPGPLDIVLPVGISFYTFQSMSYTIDVYRGKLAAERDPVLFFLYVSFFPQLVAGPIERAGDLLPQLRRRQPFSYANLEAGIQLILWGFAKKVVFGDRLGIAANPAFFNPSAYSTGELAFAAAGMFVVVYLDFSAYTDIARGTGLLFGVRLTENFRYPHAAGNIGEYWRRWHITLSNWVRDYFLRPLSGEGRPSRTRLSLTLLLSMGVIGLWHGAQWTYVVWGLANGASLIGYQLLRDHVLVRFRGHPALQSFLWRFGSWLTTNCIRIAISVLFFSPDFSRALVFYDRLYLHPTTAGFTKHSVTLGFALLAAFWLFHYAQSRLPLKKLVDQRSAPVRGVAYAAVAYAAMLGAVPSADPFIYYQF